MYAKVKSEGNIKICSNPLQVQIIFYFLFGFKSESVSITEGNRKKERLTVVAVFVFGPVDGSIRLHLQVEALLAEEPGHYPLQLRL